jgi:hypothetical protein
MDSSSAAVTSFNRNINPLRQQALFCISEPFSGFRSILTYIGKLSLVQSPPSPYHCDIDSSTHTTSEGEKLSRRCSLNRRTKSSMWRHLYGSYDMVAGLSEDWSHIANASVVIKPPLRRTVLPNAGEGCTCAPDWSTIEKLLHRTRIASSTKAPQGT